MHFRVVETFYSLQGEGVYTGVPSVFLRLFGCNFKCQGFGSNRQLQPLSEVRPEQYHDLHQLPVNVQGCDSYPAWDKRFRHFTSLKSVDDLARDLISLLPEERRLARSNHLVVTGGEPLLAWQKLYPDLFAHTQVASFSNITFETNATQILSDDFIRCIEQSDRHWLFSCSPKLGNSGESWDDAVKPNVVAQYSALTNAEVILKFVVAKSADMLEVSRAIDAYHEHGFNGNIYLMPDGATQDIYQENAPVVAQLALDHGLHYSPRLQNDLWSNAWAT